MIEKEPNMPKNITVTTQLGDNKITPKNLDMMILIL